jgi:type I restriction enzyme, S subunit
MLDLSEMRYVSEQTYRERIERLRPKAGDILYSREGGILGIACAVPAGIDLCLGQRMMLFRTSRECDGAFLMNWLNSPSILRRVADLTGGSASPHLNVGHIKQFPIPQPPLEEQREIVRRTQELFLLADRLEARYAKAKAQVDKLTQSILAKALRGELVPTEAELARREGGCTRARKNCSHV